jgi:hypothetical protein
MVALSRPITMLLIPVLGEVRTIERLKRNGDRWSVWLSENLREFFDEPWEHVAVLHGGERRDMFVGETSAINGRHIRNIRATEIYRNNTLTQSPGVDPESLPTISGPALLFPDTIVWR